MTVTFYGFVEESGRLTLDYPKAFKAFVAKRLKGREVEIDVREKGTKRTLAQNQGFHSMIAPWCQDAGHDVDVLKLQLLAHIFGTREVVNPFTGEVQTFPVEPHTSTLTVAQFSELIERTMELAAGEGYVLLAPDEYRAAHPETYGKPKRGHAA